MLRCCDQLLLVLLAALPCCLANERYCMYSGLQRIGEDNGVGHVSWISKAEDFDDKSKLQLLENCPVGDSCFECTRDENGMMSYAASCATKAEDIKGIDCSNATAQPCSSADDNSCYPKAMKIRRYVICRFLRTEDGGKIVDGDYDVYCKDGCSSARFYYDEMVYGCKGCTGYCKHWLDSKTTSYPTGLNKFCEGTDTCDLAGIPTASASDETKQGSRTRPSCWVALAAAAILCLGFGL